MSDSQFTANEWLRYTRHIQLPQIGTTGQSKLKNAHVLIVGAGGLGSPVALYLAAAGVGHITVIDGDTVDLSNLQRQIIFSTNQVGLSKAACAQQRLLELNPDITVDAVAEHLSLSNAENLIQKANLILDCTDNFATRYLINDVCTHLKKPWLFASIYQFSGQCALFTPTTACFRCLFPELPDDDIADCNTAGVIGVLPGLLGTIQANEAIKYLTGLPCALENKLLIVDTNSLNFKTIQLAKNTACSCCSKNNVEFVPADYELACEAASSTANHLSPEEFSVNLNESDDILLDVRTDEERRGFNIGGQHIPLNSLQNHIAQLDKNKSIICYCQTGLRSEQAVKLLQQHGFNAKNLRGGLAALLKLNN